MAEKSAIVSARMEPSIKMEAESIMDQLGVSASTVINMLYKQIIMTRGIPFALSVPNVPLARDEMSDEDFGRMMSNGIRDAQDGRFQPVEDAFSVLRKGLK